MRSNRNPRKGQTIVLMAAFIGFLFSLSALAFDMAFAMMIRAKLVSAMDAATLSAIRAVPKGLGSMQQAANRTFQANLPPGQLLTTNPVVNTPTMVWDNGTVRVTMGGSITAPLFFARLFGKSNITINARTVAARRDRNIILILDYSGSVGPVLGSIKDGAKLFVDSFSETYDQVGLAVFSTSGRLQAAPGFNFKSNLNTQITNMSQQLYTNHSMGLYWAYRGLRELTDSFKQYKSNELVFFTDGEANWYGADFYANSSGRSRCGNEFSGTVGIRGNTQHRKVLTFTAPSNYGTPGVTEDCSYWGNGHNYISSIKTTWTPPNSPSQGQLFPGGVSLSGFRWSFGGQTIGAPQDYSNNDSWRSVRIAKNVADNMAQVIRQDPILKTRIHTIGYRGNEPIQVDVLERMANCDGCPNATAYGNHDNEPKGRFVRAENTSELLVAFLDVAGFIGRIVQ